MISVGLTEQVHSRLPWPCTGSLRFLIYEPRKHASSYVRGWPLLPQQWVVTVLMWVMACACGVGRACDATDAAERAGARQLPLHQLHGVLPSESRGVPTELPPHPAVLLSHPPGPHRTVRSCCGAPVFAWSLTHWPLPGPNSIRLPDAKSGRKRAKQLAKTGNLHVITLYCRDVRVLQFGFAVEQLQAKVCTAVVAQCTVAPSRSWLRPRCTTS